MITNNIRPNAKMTGISGDIILPSEADDFLKLVPAMFGEIRRLAHTAAKETNLLRKIRLLAEMMNIVNDEGVIASLKKHAPEIGLLTPEKCGFRVSVSDFYELMKCIFKNSSRFISIENSQ